MIKFDEFLNINPRVQYFSEFNCSGEHKGYCFDGIQAITYDGADFGDKHTKVFAHIGFPKDLSKPVPAVVLVHGGGGHPEDIWIKKWNEKGYAAISMDTTGFFPTKPISHLYEGFSEGLDRVLVSPFAEDGYVVSPNNSGLRDCDKKSDEQWMYHAVSQVILAHNILRNDSRIDNTKIGITGISWGGVITSIAIGYDTRFAFAIPIYGSGYLGQGLSDLNKLFKKTGTQKWFAERNFRNVKMPVMWLCWNDDCCFSINSNSMSYLDTKDNNKNTCLSMLNNMNHSHYHGYTPNESYWFADTVLSNLSVPSVEVKYSDNKIIYSCTEKAKSVKLYYITEEMSYEKHIKYGIDNSFMKQEWNIVELDSFNNKADKPKDAVGMYLEFTLENDIVLTTPYKE